jgi:hypothetical protein
VRNKPMVHQQVSTKPMSIQPSVGIVWFSPSPRPPPLPGFPIHPFSSSPRPTCPSDRFRTFPYDGKFFFHASRCMRNRHSVVVVGLLGMNINPSSAWDGGGHDGHWWWPSRLLWCPPMVGCPPVWSNCSGHSKARWSSPEICTYSISTEEHHIQGWWIKHHPWGGEASTSAHQ